MDDNDIRIKSIDNRSMGSNSAQETEPEIRGNQPRPARSRSCLLVGLLIVGSFIMGGLGGLFFDGVLLSYLSKVPFLNSSGLVQMEGSKVIIQRGEKVLSNEDIIIKDLIRNTNNSVVGIRKEIKSSPSSKINIESKFLGQGIILTADGLIVTSTGVLVDKRASYQVVSNDGTVYKVAKIIHDPASEIALLKIKADGLSVAELEGSDGIKVGQTVYSLAEDQLGQVQVASTIIEGKNYNPTFPLDSAKIENYFRSRIKSVGLGSPLLNQQGKVIGINVAREDDYLLTFPASDVSSILEDVIANDKVVRLELGVGYINLNDKIAKTYDLSRSKGLLVTASNNYKGLAVKPQSPAYTGGLKANDIIIKIGADEITDRYLLHRSLQKLSVEQPVEVTYWRDNQEMKTNLTLKEIKQVE